MARARSLRPGFFTSFNLAQVPREVRLFFSGLWVEADDDGRLINSPKALAGAIFPHDDDVTPKLVARWIDQLENIGVICRYQHGTGRYLHITSWGEHQKPPHPTPSKLPNPPSPPQDNNTNPSRNPHEKPVTASREPRGEITENAALGLLSVVSCSCSGVSRAEGTQETCPVHAPPDSHAPPGQRLPDQDHEPDQTPDPPPLTPEAEKLVDRWLGILHQPTPLARADAHRWIPHLLTTLDYRVLDEIIGQCATVTPPPKRITYLVTSCRTFAAEHMPGTTITDPPHPPSSTEVSP